MTICHPQNNQDDCLADDTLNLQYEALEIDGQNILLVKANRWGKYFSH